MWVIDLENGPPRLRGTLSRWAVEVRAGLYVSGTSSKTREAVWDLVKQLARPDTNAVLVYDTTAPQGFQARTHGPNRREIVDVDGMSLARFMPLEGDAKEPEEVSERALSFDPEELEEDYLEP